jgi:hypothetical protein
VEKLIEEKCWLRCFGDPHNIPLQEIPHYMRIVKILQHGTLGQWTGFVMYEREWWQKVNFYAEAKQRRRDGG